MNREQLLELIPDYALQILEPYEQAQVQALLETDPEARRLLAEYESITGELIFNVPGRPAPAHLHTDLRQRLRKGKPRHTPHRRRILAAAAIIVIVVMGLILRVLTMQPNSGEDLFNNLVTADGSQRLTLVAHLNDDLYGELVISADGQQAVMQVFQLPAVTDEEAFQLWLIDEQGAVSGGVFQFNNLQGPNYIVLPLEKPVTAYNRFGVSLEPATGSPLGDKPSGPRVFDVVINPA